MTLILEELETDDAPFHFLCVPNLGLAWEVSQDPYCLPYLFSGSALPRLPQSSCPANQYLLSSPDRKSWRRIVGEKGLKGFESRVDSLPARWFF